MPNDDKQELSKLERIAAFLTRSDHELLSDDHPFERDRVVHEFFMLCAIYVLFTIIWATVLSTFGFSVVVALIVAWLIETIIILFDVALAATDIHPRGLLQNGALPPAFWGRIGARLLVSLLLNSGTAVGTDLFIMKDEALKAMAHEVDERNAPVRREYDARIAALSASEVEPIEGHIAELVGHQDKLNTTEGAARNGSMNAFSDSQAADLEAHRQDDGYGDRDTGDGVLARDAKKQKDLADARANRLAAQANDLRSEAAAISTQIKAAEDTLTTAKDRFAVEADRLRVERDRRLIPVSAGPMTVVLGWLKLQADPEVGLAVHLTTLIAWIVVTTLELAFFLARVVFKGEQMHDVRLGARMRRDAVALASELYDHVREHRRRRPLRVVADNGPEAPPPQDNQDAA